MSRTWSGGSFKHSAVHVQGPIDAGLLEAITEGTADGKVEEQLAQMGMTPEDVIQKIISKPELAAVGVRYTTAG